MEQMPGTNGKSKLWVLDYWKLHICELKTKNLVMANISDKPHGSKESGLGILRLKQDKETL